MERGTNALAELAEFVKGQIEYLYRDGYCGRGMKALNKAQRIVAELAKVREWFIETANKQGNDGKVGCHYFKTRCYMAFKECRAIAEEGE